MPIYDAIMSDTMTKVLLRKSKNGEFTPFPRSKHEDDETPERCAIREVMEETSYITEKLNCCTFFEGVEGSRKVKYFVIRDVPSEISRIEWFPMLKEVLYFGSVI